MRSQSRLASMSVEQDGTPTMQHRERSPDRRVRSIILLLLLVAVGAAVYWLVFHGPGQALISPAGSAVIELSGDGDQVTDEFRVREGWSIHWENVGDEFAFAITGERDFGVVVEQTEPGSGVTSPVGGGTYRLEVQADGPWTIRIVQGGE